MIGVADADAGAARHDRRAAIKPAAIADRRRRPRRPLGALRRALERLPRRVRGRARSRSLAADRAALPALAHAAGDERRQHRQEATTRRGSPTTCSSEGFGPGFNAPLLLASELPKARRPGRADADRRRAARPGRASPQVAAAAAQQARRHRDDDRLPDDDAAGRATDETVRSARTTSCRRSRRRPARACRSAARPRRNLDFSQTIRDKLPLFIGVVVGLSLLLLARRLPLAADPGQGRHLQPAVDRAARSAS